MLTTFTYRQRSSLRLLRCNFKQSCRKGTENALQPTSVSENAVVRIHSDLAVVLVDLHLTSVACSQ